MTKRLSTVAIADSAVRQEPRQPTSTLSLPRRPANAPQGAAGPQQVPRRDEVRPTDRFDDHVDRLLDVVKVRHDALGAELGETCAADKHRDPTYVRWHDHVTGLLRQIRPDADADFLGHVLLSCFDGDLVHRTVERGGPARLRTSVRDLATDLLRTDGHQDAG